MRCFNCQSVWELVKSAHLYLDWDACRQYIFSVTFVSIVVYKILYIYTHAYYLSLDNFVTWGATFFLQDVPFLLLARSLAGAFPLQSSRVVAAVITVSFSLYVSLLTAAMSSFYIIMGRDFHWGPAIGFFGDMVRPKPLVAGIFLLIFLEIVILIASYFPITCVYKATGEFIKIWTSFAAALFRRCRRRKQQPLPDPAIYEQIALNDDDDDDDDKSEADSVLLMDPPRQPVEQKVGGPSLLKRSVVILASVVVVFLSCVRPGGRAYGVLSRTLPLVPFTQATHHPVFDGIEYLPGDFSWLGNHTALDTPPAFDWLPPDEPLQGFSHWYSFHLNENNERIPKEQPPVHYNPAKDPLHTSNLHNDILEPLREVLRNGDVNIKHVIVMKLESNRQDVFPFHADSHIMQRIRDSYGGSRIPNEIHDRLSHLTPNAERLTGFDTGFGKHRPQPRGGISAKNAYTSGTFTLKSITGTMCGLNPLAVDMNHEYEHDIYQPCLPHIVEALNRQPNITSETDDWAFWPWHSMWMQSVSGEYDNLTRLMAALGYHDQMTKETIDNNGGENAPNESENVPSRGYMDTVLKSYFRDVVADAEMNHKRLFLSHLTGATHLPWTLPGHQYEDLLDNTGRQIYDYINRYLNSLAYQDGWLTDILDILQEAGVAEETLFVLVGDHGVSLPNDGGWTPHDSPHVSNEHVPLIFSHPKLPQVEVDLPVQSTQILPTILDLLIESSSLDGHSMEIVRDLLPMYQGQSMLRELVPEHKKMQEWHITTLNTGGLYLAIRSVLTSYRVVVPLIPNAKWRFTDIEADPLEVSAIKDFNILSLVNAVRREHGPEAAEWLGEASNVAQWWISENFRRWKYDPDPPK